MTVNLNVDLHGVATLTLDRPRKRNALDGSMLTDLHQRVDQIAAEPGVRAVVVRGAGGTFCAGADIADWVSPAPEVAAALSELGLKAFAALAELPVPSLAVIEGTAVGGGFELALACDVRIAAKDAVIGFPELGLGNLPAWGGVGRTIAIAGTGVARQLVLTAELISGSRAAELGLVTSAHDTTDLVQAAQTRVKQLVSIDPLAARTAKQTISRFESHQELESTLAAFFAVSHASRQLKQDFLDRKATAKAARTQAAPTLADDLESPTLTAPTERSTR